MRWLRLPEREDLPTSESSAAKLDRADFACMILVNLGVSQKTAARALSLRAMNDLGGCHDKETDKRRVAT